MKPFQFVDSSVELGSGGLADSFRDEESDGQRKSTSHSPPQNTSPFADGVLFTKIVFVLTGVAQTLLAQVAFYAGGAAPSSLLPVVRLCVCVFSRFINFLPSVLASLVMIVKFVTHLFFPYLNRRRIILDAFSLCLFLSMRSQRRRNLSKMMFSGGVAAAPWSRL
jgi:hypothetical protein